MKLRVIVARKEREVLGLTVPNEVAMFFSGCHFTIEKSGTSIVFNSGTSILNIDLNTYRFEDCRIYNNNNN